MKRSRASDVSEIIEHNHEIYQLGKWGAGHFSITDEGNLAITPMRGSSGPSIDLSKVIDELQREKIQFPVVVRFHDMIRNQVKQLNNTFRRHIQKYQYGGKYYGVYPIKVNQTREVVEEIIDAGEEFNFGLEAGSKPELLVALALNEDPNRLTVLNGYKDHEYLKLALLGRKMGKQIVVVIENFLEIPNLIALSKEWNIRPLIGFRIKPISAGSGKWKKSSGERAKFGLTTSQIMKAVDLLKENGMMDCLVLLHFHMGSQITDIRSIKEAVNEAGRYYANLYRLGAHIKFLDVGGGLGVDYDGSKSTNDSSANYDLDNYVSDIIWGLKQICELEKVPEPNIVSESGRFISANHSCIITNVIGTVSSEQKLYDDEVRDGEHILVKNIRDIFDETKESNIIESYNDALYLKKEMESAFKLGVITLHEKAKIESLLERLATVLRKNIETMEFIPDELIDFNESQAKQYVCNFSVFQSLPDTWAIGQLIPIVPIRRLNEVPTVDCTLCDITCDSDGKIDKFIGDGNGANTIKLHDLNKNEDYFLGFFMTGAYQDVMGDMHNLFGRVNEVHIYIDEEDPNQFYIEEHVKGDVSGDVLKTMQYNCETMAHTVKKTIDKMVAKREMPAREGVRLTDFYEASLGGYTYLVNNGEENGIH